MAGMLHEIRLACRGLLRSPGFTVVAVLTLALGIGATTAVFTLVDGVLLRALPYPDSDRILSLEHVGRDGEDELPISPGLYLLYAEHARSLSAVAMHQQSVVNLTGEGEPERVAGQSVTPSIHEVLRARPALGRALLPSDAEPGAEPVVLLDDALWRSRFGADPGVLDRTVTMDGVARRVVGVLPRDFSYPDGETRFWIPLSVDPATAPIGAFGATGIARMAEGVAVAGVQAELKGIIGRLEELAPEAGPVIGFLREVNLTARVQPLKEAVVGDLGRTLWTLLGMVTFVLFIACANVANLLLVRAEGRQRELAVRTALGAGRAALVRPFLAESLALGLAGGVLGVGVAALAVRTTAALAPADLPRMHEIGVDLRVLLFTLAVSLLSSVAFGLFPVLRSGIRDLSPSLREGGRGGTAGRARNRVRNGLVVVQVTLALVLLVGSGLMFRSFAALMTVDPGFRKEGVLTVRLTVPTGEMAEPAAVAGFYRQLRERLAAQPGVQAVGAVSNVPLSGQISFGGHAIEDFPTGPNEIPPMAFGLYADPGYFEAMGIRLVEGRLLQPTDAADQFRGVVVSRAYAERWWPQGSALGKRISWGGGPDQWWQIVGVVDNVHNRALQEDAEELLYLPTTQGSPEETFAVRSRDLVVRVGGDPATFLPVLRREIEELNPRVPLASPQTMGEVVRASAGETSFTMAVLGSASVVALLLGLIGIYGVISYVVSQRTREIGVRLALGATGGSVRGMVVRQGVGLALVGVGTGLAVALAASRAIDSLLYGVSSRDPLTYGAVALSLAAVAALASWIPAQRAASVDPAMALRRE